MKILLTFCMAFFIMNLKAEAQEKPQIVFNLLSKILTRNEFSQMKFQNRELKSVDLIILSNKTSEKFFKKSFDIQEFNEDNKRIFILSEEYLFVYDIKNYVQFSEIKIKSTKAELVFDIIHDKGTAEYRMTTKTFYFSKKNGEWKIL